MPYLVFSKKQHNSKLSSAANYRWRFKGQKYKVNITKIVSSVLLLAPYLSREILLNLQF